MSTIGERIRILRKELSLTQSDFGDKIGLKQAVIGQMENNTRNITDRTIILICEKYSVRKEWLCSGNGVMFVEDDNTLISQLSNQYGLDNFSRRFIETFIKLPAPQRDVIKEFAYSLVGASETDCPADCDAFSEFNIDAEVDSYRRELEQEKRVAEKSPASGGIKEA